MQLYRAPLGFKTAGCVARGRFCDAGSDPILWSL